MIWNRLIHKMLLNAKIGDFPVFVEFQINLTERFTVGSAVSHHGLTDPFKLNSTLSWVCILMIMSISLDLAGNPAIISLFQSTEQYDNRFSPFLPPYLMG